MGLDQFAIAIDKNGNKTNFAYWRKHPNLQGWMQNLWENKGRPGLTENYTQDIVGNFNGIPLELNKDDLDDLEDAIRSSDLPHTTGFFFGSNSDDYYKEDDLRFVNLARQYLDDGYTVLYDSWW